VRLKPLAQVRGHEQERQAHGHSDLRPDKASVVGARVIVGLDDIDQDV
jgi:hypothetical protein